MGLRRFFRRAAWDAERVREMEAHLRLMADDYIAEGLTPEEAWRRARVEFGNLQTVREDIYRMNTIALLEQTTADIRYAIRVLRRTPGFTLTAIATLALGIGANTAIFSVVDAVLLRPLPYARPSELVAFTPGRYAAYRDWTPAMRSLGESGAYTYSLASVTTGSEPVRVWTLAVTASLLPALGVEPALGSAFEALDDTPGAPRRVMLRHGFWKSQFGSDATVIGRIIQVDGRPHQVIGILPENLEFPPPSRRSDGSIPLTADLWTGVGWLSDLHERSGFHAIGRLAPGASAAGAATELSALARAAGVAPGDPSRFQVRRVEDAVFDPLRPAMLALTAGVALVLLIACANLGSLLLARVTTRRREVAVRVSLGASAGRVARQILTESAVLACAGAAAAVGVASILLRLLLALAPPQLARVHGATLNGRVLIVTVALGAFTALLVGALPAWRALSRDPRHDMSSGRTVTADRRTRRLHASLIMGEIGLAVVLLVAGGLLLRSFAALSRVHPGFRTDGLVTADLLVPPDRYKSRADVLHFFDRLEDRLAAHSGVLSASAIDRLPYGPSSSQIRLRIAGRPSVPGTADPTAFNTAARPGYFRTMGIRIVQGREFTPADRSDSAPVVVIGRAIAERHWPDGNALGARITVFGVEREVVGIAEDVRHFGPETPFDPMVYLPQSQDLVTRRAMTVVVRSSGSPDAAQAAVRGAIRALDRQLPISNLQAFGKLRSERTASQRFNALVIGSFAVLSLLMAALGIYGILSFAVAQRTREIGIRAALGARPRAVVALILRHSLLLTGSGLAVGIVAAAIAARYLERMLFGLEPLDPVTFAAACGTFGGVALLASYLPARRAARVDPLIALREG